MSASASNLSSAQYGYDIVVAVTQASINASLKLFMSTLQEPLVSICYVADDNGNPTPMDYDTFMTLSNGTDPFTIPNGVDPNGADFQNLLKARFMAGFRAQIGIPQVQDPASLPDIIKLTSDIGTVHYNMFCSEFTVCQISGGGYAPPTFTSISQPSDNPWYIQSTVNLNLSTVDDSAYANLPAAIQAQINNMSGSAFSVQQLLFDLNSATLASQPAIPTLQPGTPVYMMLEQYFTGAYFRALSTSGQPLLGCAVVPQTTDPSTMTITDINLMTNPYIDSSTGQPQANPSNLQKSFSTLNYLCVVNNNTLPESALFNWNWFDAADLSNIHGIVVINRNCFRDYINQNLQNYIPNVCFLIDAQCSADGLSSNMSVDFTPGGQPTLTETKGETVLSYSYSTSSSDQAGLGGDLGKLSVGTTYNTDTKFTEVNGNASVVITQHLVISCDMTRNFTQTSGNIVDKTIIDTYTLTVLNNGQLGATLVSQTTDNSVSPSTSQFGNLFNHSNEVAADIKQQADALVSTNFQDIPLSVMQQYVFPGGQTFMFKHVRFSDNQDLLASITYADPTSPPPTVPSQPS